MAAPRLGSPSVAYFSVPGSTPGNVQLGPASEVYNFIVIIPILLKRFGPPTVPYSFVTEKLIGLRDVGAPSETSDFTTPVPIPPTPPIVPVPVNRDFQLNDMLPECTRTADISGVQQGIMDSLQVCLDDVLADIDAFTSIFDLEVNEEQYVDALLCSFGNPFDFNIDLSQKRNLVRALINMFKKNGTNEGMIGVIKFFVGVTVTVDDEALVWILNVSELDFDTFLGPSPKIGDVTFRIVSAIALTQPKRDRITDIVNFMKPAHTVFSGIVEP